jgi:hypothetical protein
MRLELDTNNKTVKVLDNIVPLEELMDELFNLQIEDWSLCTSYPAPYIYTPYPYVYTTYIYGPSTSGTTTLVVNP